MGRRGNRLATTSLLLVLVLCFLFERQPGLVFNKGEENSRKGFLTSLKPSQTVNDGNIHANHVTQDAFFNLEKLKQRLNVDCKTDLPTKAELMQPPYSSWAVSRFMAYYNIVKYLNSRWHSSQIHYDLNVLDVGGSRFLKSLDVKMNITRTNNPGIDIHDTGFPENQFDAIVADQVLEHLIYPPLAMLEMHRILKPGGLAVLTTVAYNPLHEHHTFHDLWRFFPDGLRILSAPFNGGIKLCGSWGSQYFIVARSTFGQGSAKEKQFLKEERIKLLTSNRKDHPFLVWIIVEK